MDQNENGSKIQKFYEHNSVFITGSTGFIGMLLVEKLLRSCPGISHMYLLIRTKKNIDPLKRIESMFDNTIFDKLREQEPNFHEKVTTIIGDCEQLDLGISNDDRQIIIDRVNIIFHAAATVKFNEHLRKATNINLIGTKTILKIASEMKHLKAFIHISTAYSHCVRNEIDERFYKPPIEEEKLINLIDLFDDQFIDVLTPSLLKNWPNSYSFTKALAESVIERESKTLPIIMVRPSIVMPTENEPIEGWMNNLYGVAGVTVGAGYGIIRMMHINGNLNVDLVPADYVVNFIIAATSYIQQKDISNLNKSNQSCQIYNYVCNPDNPITWNRYRKELLTENEKLPVKKLIWYPVFYYQQNIILFTIFSFVLHTIPGWIFDTGLILLGKKPKLTKIYKKFHAAAKLICYFTKQSWTFHNNNVRKLWKQLNKTDQQLFPFDMKTIDWHTYSVKCIKGSREFFFHESIDTLAEAKRKLLILKYVHYTFVATVSLLLLWGVNILICFFI